MLDWLVRAVDEDSGAVIDLEHIILKKLKGYSPLCPLPLSASNPSMLSLLTLCSVYN